MKIKDNSIDCEIDRLKSVGGGLGTNCIASMATGIIREFDAHSLHHLI